MVNAILQVKPPYDVEQVCIDKLLALRPDTANTDNAWLRLLAIEALETFGEGGNPDPAIIEDTIGECNTPAQHGYVRIDVPEYYGQALEYVAQNGGSEYATLVWVGWPGVPEPVIEWTNEDGSVQQLGRFA